MVEASRSLGFWVAYAIGLGTMIAAGIFSLSGQAVAAIGSSAVIAFVIAAGIAGITAAAYSEFASIYSESGGGYLFTSRTFDNDYAVYVEGVMLFLGYSATTAFYLATMGEWVHEFVLPVPAWSVGVGTALLLGALNARGTEESGSFQIIVTAAKVVVLLVFVGGAFTFQPPMESIATFMTSFSTDLPGILNIASLAFITFFGFSAIAASAGEIIEPRRTVPKAIAASIITVTILYTLVIVAMVNSPIDMAIIAEQGETAMGMVAAAFLGGIGRDLIVAGAIFSMVSASNASILAASRIGFLMGREGRAFRRFQDIHQRYGTPHWGVGACTFTIVTLILVFTGVFPAEHGFAGINLGLEALTGFANLNLLVPLSVVNVALILSRRKFKDIDRPFAVPGVPLTPVIGILANLALVVSLPGAGIVTGIIGIGVFFIIYVIWGGGASVEELMTVFSEREEVIPVGTGIETAENTIIVPVSRASDVRGNVRLADRIAQVQADTARIEVIHIENVPEQVPSDAADTTKAEEAVEQLKEELAGMETETPVAVHGYISQDVAFSILQLARKHDADLLVMGYPKENWAVVEAVQHRTPCDVVYAYGVDKDTAFDTIGLGVGEGESHRAMLELVDAFGAAGSDIHVIHVEPEYGGTPEEMQSTLDRLQRTDDLTVHQIQEKHVAQGLVDQAKEHNAVLVIGASRDFHFKHWLFGSTPDRVIDIAEEAGVPVIIYRNRATLRSALSNAAFLLHRTVHALR